MSIKQKNREKKILSRKCCSTVLRWMRLCQVALLLVKKKSNITFSHAENADRAYSYLYHYIWQPFSERCGGSLVLQTQSVEAVHAVPGSNLQYTVHTTPLTRILWRCRVMTHSTHSNMANSGKNLKAKWKSPHLEENKFLQEFPMEKYQFATNTFLHAAFMALLKKSVKIQTHVIL